MVIGVFTSGIANGICRGILASKHKTRALPSLVLVKKFYNSATVPSYFYDSTLATCISIILFFLSLSAT